MTSVQGQSENKAARRPQLIGILLIVSVAALFLLAIWVASLLPLPLRYGIWIGIAVIPAVSVCYQPFAFLLRKPRTGAILLNLGYQNKAAHGRIAMSAFLSALWFFSLFIAGSFIRPVLVILQFGLGVFYIADAISKIIASREPTLVTEKGFYWPEGMVLWSKIESHQWLQLREEVSLVLKLKGRPWPLEERKLRVPTLLMTDVDKILRERI